jgi:outer membrane protein TolC
MFFSNRIGAVVAAAAVLSSTLVGRAAAQQPAPTRPVASTAPGAARALSLDEALRIAERESESLQIARAGVDRARGTLLQARSQYLPQLSGSLNYTRTLKSQFSALQTSSPEPGPNVPPVPASDTTTYFQPCTRYLAAPGATEAQRLAGLETFSRCSSGGGIDFTRVGFGSKNQYQLGLSGSVNLFTGGRVGAQNSAAKSGRRSADIELTAQRAQLQLDVAQAYYDAALADRLVAIADSSLVQTEEALRQTSLARQVGNQSEFELLRARVTRDNQIPAVLQAKTARELTYLRLKQLLNLPYGDSLTLTDGIGDTENVGQVRAAAATNSAATAAAMVVALTDSLVRRSDTTSEARSTVRQLVEAVNVQESQRRIAKAEYLPNLTLSSAYGRVAFPNAGIPDWNSFVNNWTVSVGATMPIFTGGRIRGENAVASANVTEARARLQQTREYAALDARQAVAQLEQSAAMLAASSGTTEQATRAYSIAEVRFREGLSTQLELSESRVLLQQARANRAQAARDFQVARLRLTLLKDLPLGSSSTTGSAAGAAAGSLVPGAAGGAGAVQQQQQQPQTQPRAGQSAASVSAPGQ